VLAEALVKSAIIGVGGLVVVVVALAVEEDEEGVVVVLFPLTLGASGAW
jgi:hypothetical protein